MKHLLTAAFCVCLMAAGQGWALEPQVLHKEPLPKVQPVVITDPVPVPETIGATLLAGVGFFMIFRRRRYS